MNLGSDDIAMVARAEYVIWNLNCVSKKLILVLSSIILADNFTFLLCDVHFNSYDLAFAMI